jgi:hypothetical protein
MVETRYEIDDVLDKIREDLLGYLNKPKETISKEPNFIIITEAEYLALKDKKYNVVYCCSDTNKLYLGDTRMENYKPIIDHAEVKDNNIIFTTVDGVTISAEIKE